jgi:R3H-associated N-terminal domain
MATRPILISQPQASPAIRQGASAEAWTKQATETLRSVNLSAAAVQCSPGGTSVALSVSLDARRESEEAIRDHGTRHGHPTDRGSEPVRRDSLKRREALLKGKEGSRQRRRWENGTLLNE